MGENSDLFKRQGYEVDLHGAYCPRSHAVGLKGNALAVPGLGAERQVLYRGNPSGGIFDFLMVV